MSMSDVRTALAQAVVDAALFPEEDIAWENVAFEPGTGNRPWCKFSFVPASVLVDTLGQNGLDLLDGFVQLDFNYPLGTGDDDAMQKYVATVAVFKAGARFTSNGQVAVIKNCGRNNGANVSGFYRVSVTIMFYAQIQR